MNLLNVSLRLSLSATLLLLAGTARAQSPTNTNSASAQATPTKDATAEIPAPSATIVPVEPASIIPPNSLPGPGAAGLPKIPAAPELEQLNALFKQSSLGKAADDHRLLVQTAELETKIRNDQDLHALLRAADTAHTDLVRRHRLRAYYEAYYKKLLARATTPELRAFLTSQKASHQRALLQPSVRHETDEAEVTRLFAEQAGVPAPSPVPTPVQAKVKGLFHP